MALGSCAGRSDWSQGVAVWLGHVLGLIEDSGTEGRSGWSVFRLGPFPPPSSWFVIEKADLARGRKAQVAQVVSQRNVWTKEESGVLLRLRGWWDVLWT